MYSTLSVESKIKNYSVEFISSIDDIFTLICDNNVITFIDSNVHRLYPQL